MWCSMFTPMVCVPVSFQESYDAYAFLFAMIAAVPMHVLEVQLDLMFAGGSAPAPPVEPVEKQNITGSAERASVCADEGGCGGHRSHGVLLVAEGGAQRITSALLMGFGVTWTPRCCFWHSHSTSCWGDCR